MYICIYTYIYIYIYPGYPGDFFRDIPGPELPGPDIPETSESHNMIYTI